MRPVCTPLAQSRLLRTRTLGLVLLAAVPVARGAAPLNPAIESATRGGYLTYDRLHLSHIETLADGSTLDSDTGTLKGFSAGWTWLTPSGFYAQFGAGYHKGKVTYVGHTFGGTPVTGNQDTDRAMSVPAVRFGHMFAAGQNGAITPYLRLGMHGIGRIIGVTPTTPNGQYNEALAFWYAGLGMQAQYAVTDRLVGQVTLGYDVMPYAVVDILYSGGSCRENLGRKGVETAGLGLNYRVSARIHLISDFSVRRFDLGQSQPFVCGADTLYEPKSSNTETTARVGLQF